MLRPAGCCYLVTHGSDPTRTNLDTGPELFHVPAWSTRAFATERSCTSCWMNGLCCVGHFFPNRELYHISSFTSVSATSNQGPLRLLACKFSVPVRICPLEPNWNDHYRLSVSTSNLQHELAQLYGSWLVRSMNIQSRTHLTYGSNSHLLAGPAKAGRVLLRKGEYIVQGTDYNLIS